MFKSLNRVVYRVSDLEKAKHWYRNILDTEPTFDSPIAVVFSIGDSGLILSPSPNPVSKSNDSVLAFWGVDDVNTAYKQLLQAGAAPHTEITSSFGTRRATVSDPFGNIVGIIGTAADKSKRSVEQQPSETALAVTFARALAALDAREEIKGNDYLAETFLTEDRKSILKNPDAREWLIKTPPGMYEYMIARTAYFDRIVEQALRENIPQIVFLGAGYDSRPYRFKALIKETRIFEVDAHPTQHRKKELLQKANIPIPEQVAFVSVNFNTDSLKDVLFKAGLDKNKKTVFIWEGVTFYLPSKAVDDTLNFMTSNSPAGSTVCFDTVFPSRDGSDGYGVKELREAWRTNFPGEATFFAIEEEKIGPFLSERGFQVVEHLTTKDMERKYLTLPNGSLVGKVTDLFCFIRASVSG